LVAQYRIRLSLTIESMDIVVWHDQKIKIFADAENDPGK